MIIYVAAIVIRSTETARATKTARAIKITTKTAISKKTKTKRTAGRIALVRIPRIILITTDVIIVKN